MCLQRLSTGWTNDSTREHTSRPQAHENLGHTFKRSLNTNILTVQTCNHVNKHFSYCPMRIPRKKNQFSEAGPAFDAANHFHTGRQLTMGCGHLSMVCLEGKPFNLPLRWAIPRRTQLEERETRADDGSWTDRSIMEFCPQRSPYMKCGSVGIWF